MSPPSVGDKTYGTLSLLSSAPDAFDAESETLAAVFATHATVALADAEHRRNLTSALHSRDVIGQAKGILMERHRLTLDTAFAVLVKASQNTHRKLRDICDEPSATGVLPSAAGSGLPSRD